MTTLQDFDHFQAEHRAQGFDEVLERLWKPDAVTGIHSHGFGVKALVAQGEMWLSVGADTQHLRAGDRFELERDVPHAERYGAEGATIWVARKN